MTSIRQPSVAGSFYPGDRDELESMIDSMLREAREKLGDDRGPAPKAIIAPHAGYIYSGPVAAFSYLRLGDGRDRIRRVILLGPTHFVYVEGVAVTSSDEWLTPLGSVPIDLEGRAAIQSLPQVKVSNLPHGREHSMEVQVPFLQKVLGEFVLLPIAVGDCAPADVGEVLEKVWGGDETAIVISTDLSHYHPYEDARRIDSRTADSIDALSRTDIAPEEACGCRPVNGFIHAARAKGMNATRLDLRNSGDTAGPRDGVVGYGAWEVHEESSSH